MQRYQDLVELARLCWRQAQTAQTEGAARTFRQMATEYLEEAVQLDDEDGPETGQAGRRPPAEQ